VSAERYRIEYTELPLSEEDRRRVLGRVHAILFGDQRPPAAPDQPDDTAAEPAPDEICSENV
jgi:hypothetical protein